MANNSLAAGAFLGSYRIRKRLGNNVLGEVYVAKSTSRQRFYALTVLREEIKAPADYFSSLSRMEHPAIIGAGALEEDQGKRFVTADFVESADGEQNTLEAEMARCGTVGDDVARSWIRQLCGALEYAHGFEGAGIFHGGLKPENILLSKQGQIRVAEFGYAALQGNNGVVGDLRALGEVIQTITGGQGRWAKLVSACRNAGEAGGYLSAREVLADLDGAGSGGKGKRNLVAFAVVAALLLVVATMLAVKVVGKQKEARRLAAEEKQAEEERAAKIASAEKFLTAATAALAKGQPEVASRLVERVLEAVPDHEKALILQADIRTQAGMERVKLSKNKADEVWSKVRALDAAKVLRPQIEKMGEKYKTARQAFMEMKFDTADALYREFSVEAEKLLGADSARVEAMKLAESLDDAREQAIEADAPKHAKEEWDKANAVLESGKVAFAALQFEKTVQIRKEATELFNLARRNAKGRVLALTERLAYQKEDMQADTELRRRADQGKLEEVEALAKKGAELEKEQKWLEAGASYLAARRLLVHCLDTATGVGAEDTLPPPANPGERSKGELVVNGDLEKGRGVQPESWSVLDGLTATWSKKGKKGSCIELDTGVLQVDKDRYVKMIADGKKIGKNETLTGIDVDPNAAKQFQRSKGGQYSTVGAHEGVWAFPPPVRISSADKYFIVEADVLGPAKSTPLFYPQVFIRGFRVFNPKYDTGRSSWFHTPHAGGPAYSEQFGTDEQRRRARVGDCLMTYRHSLVCRNSAANIWEHYSLAFKLPDNPGQRPEILLLKAYAMWPLGKYRFDNISLRSVTKEEYEAVKKKGHSIKGFMPTE